MYCTKCGKKLEEDAKYCRYCGNDLHNNNKSPQHISNAVKTDNNSFFIHKKHITIGIFIVIVLIYVLSIRCKAGFCPLPSTIKGDYCMAHTCNKSDCYNEIVKGENYCYTHSLFESSDEIAFSNIRIDHNSIHTICTATIKNNGRKTYSFVEVKGRFINSSGTIVDTEWTYAVGSEGLAPGESTTFELHIDKNLRITECDLVILDYDKD